MGGGECEDSRTLTVAAKLRLVQRRPEAAVPTHLDWFTLVAIFAQQDQ
jgi:hypothetical protein